jgi:hypothetical protein
VQSQSSWISLQKLQQLLVMPRRRQQEAEEHRCSNTRQNHDAH